MVRSWMVGLDEHGGYPALLRLPVQLKAIARSRRCQCNFQGAKPSLRGAKRRSNPFFLHAARWIASRSLSSGARSRDPLARNDVAPIIRSRSRDINCPSLASRSAPRKQRAQGKPGARCTRSLVCSVLVAHECSHHRSPGHPAFPAQWFTAYAVLSPASEFVLSPSSADKVLSDPVGLTLPPPT